MTLRRLIVERMLAASTDDDSDAAFAAFASETEGEITRMNRLMKALRRDGVSDSAAIVVAIRQLEQLVR
jgi:NAD-specific glutamate dehydrogenase